MLSHAIAFALGAILTHISRAQYFAAYESVAARVRAWRHSQPKIVGSNPMPPGGKPAPPPNPPQASA